MTAVSISISGNGLFQCLVFSERRGILPTDRQTDGRTDRRIHTYIHTYIHKPTTVCLRGSAHQGITNVLVQYTHSNCYMILIHVFLMFTTLYHLYDHNTCVSVMIFIVITMSSFTPVTMTVLVIDCCRTQYMYEVYLSSNV